MLNALESVFYLRDLCQQVLLESILELNQNLSSNMKTLKNLLLCLPLFVSAAIFNPLKIESDFDLDKVAVEVSSGLWMSKYEVSNTLYKAFLMDVIGEGRADEIPDLAPDVTVWERDLSFNDPYTQYYFKHPAFESYPVVGVSYAAAVEFCNWMTAKYGEHVESKAWAKDVKLRFKFRLPTQAEWEHAASREGKVSTGFYAGGFSYPRDAKGKYLFNHKLGKGNFAGVAGTKNWRDYEGYMITAPVDAGFDPDPKGLYHLSGNVAEMVAEPNIAKGGSWADEAPACYVEAVKTYDAPSALIGFRFVLEKANATEVGLVD